MAVRKPISANMGLKHEVWVSVLLKIPGQNYLVAYIFRYLYYYGNFFSL